MHFSFAHRRFTIWLSLFAMVLGALAPALAQATVALSDRAQWVEVCSSSGMVWVKLDAKDAAKTDAHGNKGDKPWNDAAADCPWFILHGGSAGLPPGEAGVATPTCTADLAVALFHTVTIPAVWAAAQARAPPPHAA